MKTSIVCLSVLLAVFLLTGCGLVPFAFEPQGAQAQSDLSFTFEGVTINLDPGLAASASGQVVPGQPASADAPYWGVYPQYVSIALEGYPVTKSTYHPLIAVYPVKEYRSTSGQASQTLDDLTRFLAEKPNDGRTIPALPLRNDVQSFRSNLKYLDFQNGHGVRFLAFYSQGPVPVNNNEFFYAFQGLTSDGKYVISAILPVTNLDLPDTSEVSAKQAEGLVDYPGYISKLVVLMNQKPGSSFTPDLAKLDALIESLQIGQ